MQKRFNIIILSFLIAGTLIHVFYQNCSGSFGGVLFSREKMSQNDPAESGNGDGYFGKPDDGEYVRLNSEKSLNAEIPCVYNMGDVLSNISVLNGVPSLTFDACFDLNYLFTFNDSRFHFSHYNPNFIGFDGKIFEKQPPPPLNNTQAANDIWCYSFENNEGIDVVIKTPKEINENQIAHVISGHWDPFQTSWSSNKSDPFIVTKDQNELSRQYSGQDFSLTVSISSVQDSSRLQKQFNGDLLMNLNNTLIKRSMACYVSNTLPAYQLNLQNILRIWPLNGAKGDILKNTSIVDASKKSEGGVIVDNESANNSTSNGLKFSEGVLGESLLTSGWGSYINVSPIYQQFQTYSIVGWFRSVANDQISGKIYAEYPVNSKQQGCKMSVVLNFPVIGDLTFKIQNREDSFFYVRLTHRGGNNDGNWHHFAVTARINEFKLYVDGIQKDRQLVTEAPDISLCTNQQGSIAYAETQGGIFRVFRGNIDELAIWGRILSNQEILEIYNNQKP